MIPLQIEFPGRCSCFHVTGPVLHFQSHSEIYCWRDTVTQSHWLIPCPPCINKRVKFCDYSTQDMQWCATNSMHLISPAKLYIAFVVKFITSGHLHGGFIALKNSGVPPKNEKSVIISFTLVLTEGQVKFQSEHNISGASQQNMEDVVVRREWLSLNFWVNCSFKMRTTQREKLQMCKSLRSTRSTQSTVYETPSIYFRF